MSWLFFNVNIKICSILFNNWLVFHYIDVILFFFNYFSDEGHLGYFQFCSIATKLQRTLLYLRLFTCKHNSLEIASLMELLSKHTAYFILVPIAKLFSTKTLPHILSSSVYERVCISSNCRAYCILSFKF